MNRCLSALRPALLGFALFHLVVAPCSIAATQEVVSTTPADSGLKEAAIEAYRNHNFAAAAALYEELIEAEPDNGQHCKDLMWVYWEMESYDECLLQARAVLALDGQNQEAMNMAASALHRMAEYDRAKEAYESILSAEATPKPATRLAYAQVLEALRDYDGSRRELLALVDAHPEFTRVQPSLGRVLQALGYYEEAAAAWADAAKHDNRPAYRYAAAESLFLAGHGDDAVRQMAALLEQWPDHARARDFLVRYMMVRGNLKQATELLANGPRPTGSAAAPFLVRLAGMYLRQEREELALSCLDEALEALPDYGEALLLKAELLRRAGQEEEAASLFQKVTAANSWSVRGWQGLADARLANDDVEGALTAVRSARKVDPTAPDLVIREAQYRCYTGEPAAAKKMLGAWLAANRESPLVVLLYHGLTKRADDPLLASRVHLQTERFEEQVKALSESGYKSVTGREVAEWYGGQGALPDKAVWIVFDDGRLDSFREATPVLERYGLKAAMFVAGCNADRNLPGYATWEELLAYQSGGVWELQSHGDLASMRNAVSEDGRSGLYLPNRLWVQPEGRLETQGEWQQRVAEEYARGKRKIRDQLGKAPVALAWPEGNFGQEGIPTVEGSAAYNVEQTRKHYALAFHQDRYGQNVRNQDPMMLRRLEPSPDWSGGELVRHLAAHTPAVRVLRQLLSILLEERDAVSARRAVVVLGQMGISRTELLGEELRVLYLEERYPEAASVAEELLGRLETDGRRDDKEYLQVLNTLGYSLQREGRLSQAEQVFDRSLRAEPGQAQIWVAAARVAEGQRSYASALRALEQARLRAPDMKKLSATRARLLGHLLRYEEAAQAWAMAAKNDPNRPEYLYAEAEALFLAGRGDDAIRRMVALLKQWPDHERARDFLVRHTMVRGDMKRATALLAKGRHPSGDAVAPFLVRLAGMYLRQEREEIALSCLDQALEAVPGDGEALLLKAELLRRVGRDKEAATLFERVTIANSWSVRGWSGLSAARMAGGNMQGALAAVRSAREVDPTNPGLLIREAQCQYHAGETGAAKEMLGAWLEANREPPLAVLLYHGLTKRADDPLLASRVHLRTERFEEQLKALSESGYKSVTGGEVAEWYGGKGSLPDKAVWIVFDDGRLDSFREATPVLKRYGLKAAMFVAGHNADRNLPGYATWEELLVYQAGGVWELQSHGDLASVRDAVSKDGLTGLYVPNRFWMKDEGRLETQDEWKQRVAEEYARGKRKMRDRLGNAPLALAWPEGNFGQEGIPTAEGSAPYNVEQTRANFALAFHQDRYGQNVRTRDPMMLRRLEPDPDWSGEDLVRHLADQAPAVRVQAELLKQATWEGRIRAADEYLLAMQSLGISDGMSLQLEALIHSAAGDHGKALDCALKAADVTSMEEVEPILRTIGRRNRRRLESSVRYWEDGDGRSSWATDAEYESIQRGRIRLRTGIRVAEHREEELSSVFEWSPFMGVSLAAGRQRRVDLQLSAHSFDGDASDLFGGSGSWQVGWTDRLRTYVTVERTPVYTVQALVGDIRLDRASGSVVWRPDDRWQATVRMAVSEYSDGNERGSTSAEVLRNVDAVDGLALSYLFTYDDTSGEAIEYYTPQQLVMHRLGITYDFGETSDRLRLRLRYLPGYGIEKDQDSRVVHAGGMDLTWLMRPGLRLRPVIAATHTPTYRSASGRISLLLDF